MDIFTFKHIHANQCMSGHGNGCVRNMISRHVRASHFLLSTTWLEYLESRLFLSGMPLDYVQVTPLLDVQSAVDIAYVGGVTPGQIRQAYDIDQIHFTNVQGSEIIGDGTGQTIAIVTAYYNPKIESDLKIFNAQFGLPETDGQGKYVMTHVSLGRTRGDPIWSLETALDVQWAHAIAPGAHILLVEARSANLTDMFAAVNYAKNQPGVSTVSMSWGTEEFYGEWAYDKYFTSPRVQGRSKLTPGVTFIAASGDDGAPGSYPAMAPEVLAVGGTKLSLDAQGLYLGETGWYGSGGGASYFLAQPDYQQDSVTSFSRTNPDISYAADPSTGFPVYCSTYQGGGWIRVGGTSAGAPQWAGIIAIADQGRVVAGLAPLDGATQTLRAIYDMSAESFHDIIVGYNGFGAAAGYDLVTGRGTPNADMLVQNLVDVPDQIRPQQLVLRTIAIAKVLPWYRRPVGARLVAESETSNINDNSTAIAPPEHSLNLENVSHSHHFSDWKMVDIPDDAVGMVTASIVSRLAALDHHAQQSTTPATVNTHDMLWHHTHKQDFHLHNISDASQQDAPLVDLVALHDVLHV